MFYSKRYAGEYEKESKCLLLIHYYLNNLLIKRDQSYISDSSEIVLCNDSYRMPPSCQSCEILFHHAQDLWHALQMLTYVLSVSGKHWKNGGVRILVCDNKWHGVLFTTLYPHDRLHLCGAAKKDLCNC